MLHVWDIPIIIICIAMVVMFFIHRSNMKKIEDAYEKKLSEQALKKQEPKKDDQDNKAEL